MRLTTRLTALACILTSSAFLARAQEKLNRHPVRLDSTGKLLSWVTPQSQAYDEVLRLAWEFLLTKVAVDPQTGLEVYYTSCCYNLAKNSGTAWPHNPAGLYAMLADSTAAWYAYSGDPRVVELEKRLLDYQLQHGTTPATWLWGNVPYASSDHGVKEYRGAYEFQYDKKDLGRGDGYGVIEPDKVGELGFAYLKYYKLTGEARYRDAAIACGNALARNIRPGDADHSPWPFRVYAETGHIREEYSANTVGALKLFDELIRLRLGAVEQYAAARAAAWKWFVEFPLRNNVWACYFEDVGIADKPWNYNQYSPMETARYLLDHPEADPAWRTHVPALLDFVEKTFGGDSGQFKGMQFGARAISEQLAYMPKMGSHTSRYASVLARWGEVSGDAAAVEAAFRSLNWATYMCWESGAVWDAPDSEQEGPWFSDGYGDYVRHFLYAMGAQPQWAPEGENHILRSTSVVTRVAYAPTRVAYTTFDADSAEVLRLAFVPSHVTCAGAALPKKDRADGPGWSFDPKRKVLRVRHTQAGEVVLE